MSNNLGEIYGTVKDGRSCITIDSSSVDVTGNLITKGIDLFMSNEYLVTADPNGILNRFNNVVNIPATDSCGNDLAANTTYEITTGPTGNINNISFVKKLPEYILSASKNGHQDLLQDTPATITNWSVLAQKNVGTNDFNISTGVWTCPASGLYELYLDAQGHNTQNGIWKINAQVRLNEVVIKETEKYFQTGYMKYQAIVISTTREIETNNTIDFRIKLASSGTTSDYNLLRAETGVTSRTEMCIKRVG